MTGVHGFMAEMVPDYVDGLELPPHPETWMFKHAGPGNHPNGSPQAVHGGGAAVTMRNSLDRLQAVFPNARITWGSSPLDQYLTDLEVYPEEVADPIASHPEVYGPMIDRIVELATEYPTAAARLDEVNLADNRLGENAMGGFSAGHRILAMAGHKYNSPEKQQSLFGAVTMASKYDSMADFDDIEDFGDVMRGVVTHEWGHVLHFNYLDGNVEAYTSNQNRGWDYPGNYLVLSWEQDRDKIAPSRYGRTNTQEFVAESYLEWKSGGSIDPLLEREIAAMDVAGR